MKKCNKCKENKELLKFDKDKNKKDGLQSQCKLCLNKWRKDNNKKVKKNQGRLSILRAKLIKQIKEKEARDLDQIAKENQFRRKLSF